MSLETLNRIFGEAIINASFCSALLTDPSTAVRDYELGTEEAELFSSIRAGSVDNLAQQLIAGLNLERGNVSRLPDLGGRYFGISGGHGPTRSSLPATTFIGRVMTLPSAC